MSLEPTGGGLELTEDLLQLSELFPDVPLAHINHVLKASQNDMFSASEQLLAYDLIKDNLEEICEMTNSELIAKVDGSALQEKPWVILEPKDKDSLQRSEKRDKGKGKGKGRGKGKGKDKHSCNDHQIQARAMHSYSEMSHQGTSRRRMSDSLGLEVGEMSSGANTVSSLALGTNSSSTSTDIISTTVEGAMESLRIRRLAERFEVQDTIMELLGIRQRNIDLLEYYLERNHYQKLETVYDIMLNFDETLTPSEQTHHSIENIRLSPKWNMHAIEENSIVSMSDVLKKGMKNITVAENDSCWHELQVLIDLNPQLELPKEFYMTAINWFDKDIDKVLNLAIIMNDYFDYDAKHKSEQRRRRERDSENRYELSLQDVNVDLSSAKLKQLSISDPQSFFQQKEEARSFDEDRFCLVHNDRDNEWQNTKNHKQQQLHAMEWRARKLKQSLNSTNDKSLKTYYTSSISSTQAEVKNLHGELQAEEVEHKINQAKSSFRIDLHNLSVKNAIYALDMVVSYWWSYEMDQRNVSNTKFEFTKACHVEPFMVITGRGLHSSGGIPKIKRAAVQYLKDNGYKFEENMSTISILGRRR
jgi:hypothetical protein